MNGIWCSQYSYLGCPPWCKDCILEGRPQGGGPHDIVRRICNSKARNQSMSPSEDFVWLC